MLVKGIMKERGTNEEKEKGEEQEVRQNFSHSDSQDSNEAEGLIITTPSLHATVS